MAETKETGWDVIRHPDYHFKCKSIARVVDAKTIKLIVDVGNNSFPPLSETYARQLFKALQVFFINFLPSSRTKPALRLLRGDITLRQEYKLIGTLPECAVLVSEFDRWLNRKYKKLSRRRRNAHRAGFRWWLVRLANEGVVPQGLTLVAESAKGDQGRRENSSSKTFLDFELPIKARRELEGLVSQADLDSKDTREAEVLFQHIAKEMKDHKYEISGRDIPDLVIQILSDRLEVVRLHVEKEFNEARDKRLNGLLRIRKGRKHLPLFDSFMGWEKGPGQGKSNPFKADVELLTIEDFDSGMLAWCWYRNKGIFFRWGYHSTAHYTRFQRAKEVVGSHLNAETAQELMGCSRQMLIAGQIIIVHDSAANISSVRQLTLSSKYETIGGLSGLLAYKQRAGRTQTLLDVIVGERTPPSKVARTIINATRHYRKHCIPKDAEKLFLMSYQNSSTARSRKTSDIDDANPISSPSDSWFNEHSKEVIKAASNDEWIGTTKSIRHSILLLDALTGGVSAVQQKAQHKHSLVSTVYSNRLAKRLQLDVEIREFLDWLQVLVAINIDEFATKMDLDGETFELQKDKIVNSHFGGFHCKNPREGIQPGTKKGEVCGEISQCMVCPNRSHLFVATEHNLLHVLLWNAALIKAYKDGVLGDQPIREWRMWGYFIESILLKVESDVAYRAVLAGAKNLVEKILKSSNPYDKYFSS